MRFSQFAIRSKLRDGLQNEKTRIRLQTTHDDKIIS